MSANPIVQVLQNHIGKPFTANPSQYAVWLGGILREAEEGKLTVEYVIRKEMLNGMGTFHGGVIAGILDDLMGTTVVSLNLENAYTTISLHVDYFYPAKENDVVTAKSSVIKKGNTLHNIQCELWNLSTNKLLARGTSNLLKIDLKVSYPKGGLGSYEC